MRYLTHHVEMSDGLQLEIELRYRKNRGTSWYTGQEQRRGLVLDFTPVRIAAGDGYRTKTYTLGDNRGQILFLEEWARQSDRRGREMAAVVEARIDRIAAAALAREWQRIFAILGEGRA